MAKENCNTEEHSDPFDLQWQEKGTRKLDAIEFLR